jgi:hypothetical protein
LLDLAKFDLIRLAGEKRLLIFSTRQKAAAYQSVKFLRVLPERASGAMHAFLGWR